MSDSAMAGKGVLWPHGGKEYLLAATDVDMELLFRTVHESWARLRIEACRSRVGEGVYLHDVDAFGRRQAANQFAFNGPLSLEFLASEEGQMEYVLLKLQKGSTQGGSPISRQELEKWRKEPHYKTLVGEVLVRDFPLAFTPVVRDQATP